MGLKDKMTRKMSNKVMHIDEIKVKDALPKTEAEIEKDVNTQNQSLRKKHWCLQVLR